MICPVELAQECPLFANRQGRATSLEGGMETCLMCVEKATISIC